MFSLFNHWILDPKRTIFKSRIAIIEVWSVGLGSFFDVTKFVMYIKVWKHPLLTSFLLCFSSELYFRITFYFNFPPIPSPSTPPKKRSLYRISPCWGNLVHCRAFLYLYGLILSYWHLFFARPPSTVGGDRWSRTGSTPDGFVEILALPVAYVTEHLWVFPKIGIPGYPKMDGLEWKTL